MRSPGALEPSYFALKNGSRSQRSTDFLAVAAVTLLTLVAEGALASFQPARAPILTRLWAKTPCPHQVRAPAMPVSSVRFQP